MMLGLALLEAELFEKRRIDLERLYGFQPQLELLEHVEELVRVNEFYRSHTVANRFPTRLGGKGAGCEDDALVSASLHRPAERPNIGGRYDRALGVTFALEKDPEADERVDLECPVAIDSTVTATAGDHHLHEARFTKQPLAEMLESRSRQFPEEFEEASPVARASRRPAPRGRLLGFGGISFPLLSLDREYLNPPQKDLTRLGQ